jgi:hypothetical protein
MKAVARRLLSRSGPELIADESSTELFDFSDVFLAYG